MLGEIHLLAGEERGDPVREVRVVRGPEQRSERVGVDALLGDVEAPSIPLECERVDSVRVADEELVQRRRAKSARALGKVRRCRRRFVRHPRSDGAAGAHECDARNRCVVMASVNASIGCRAVVFRCVRPMR